MGDSHAHHHSHPAGDHDHELRQHSHGHHGQKLQGDTAALHAGDMQMHAMAFHFGVNETILFGFWRTSSAFGILFACLLIVFACFGLELSRWYRLHRKRRLQRQYHRQQAADPSMIGHSSSSTIRLAETAISANGVGGSPQPASNSDEALSARLLSACPDACLFAVQLTLGYLLMLVFMTFNVWLCLAIVLGEVGARLALAVCFPQLDFVGTILNNAAAEPSCCG